MTNPRRMPALSPEEIRRISEKAVATVAAQKIVTNRTATVSASGRVRIVGEASQSNHTVDARASLTDRARNYLNRAGISQSDGRKYLQESFDRVRKTLKA